MRPRVSGQTHAALNTSIFGREIWPQFGHLRLGANKPLFILIDGLNAKKGNGWAHLGQTKEFINGILLPSKNIYSSRG